MAILYSCETDKHCDRHILPATWKELDPYRIEHDNDDLYIVCAECAIGYEIVRSYAGFCVIRDAPKDGRRR